MNDEWSAATIDVCECLPTGGIKKHEYRQSGHGMGRDSVTVPYPALDTALRIARKIIEDLRHPCWIERSDQPASFPTIQRGLRQQLRWSRPKGGTH
jgi:hypothetical protein